ncbi:MAG: thioredoxin [Oscillospiraceae bacterium]|nr:thioredoxin [Oscillospiraceae bacterium]
MAIEKITNANFEALVLNNPKPVLLDFWAPWCGPCRMVAPIVEQIAAERTDVTVGKINVDEEMELAVRFGIVSIPTLIVMKNGEISQKAVGYMSKDSILKLL